jgi:hypothetical protein
LRRQAGRRCRDGGVSEVTRGGFFRACSATSNGDYRHDDDGESEYKYSDLHSATSGGIAGLSNEEFGRIVDFDHLGLAS